MRKILIIVGAIILVAVGYWLISPLLIDNRISESLPENLFNGQEIENSIKPIMVGSFSGFDRAHQGSGDVSIYKTDKGYLVRFEENFKVTNGPDLYVGFGRNGVYVPESQVAKLKGNIGSQNYLIPKDVEIDKYNEVWIWCKTFSVPFAKAKIN